MCSWVDKAFPMSLMILGWVLPIPPFLGLGQAYRQVRVVGQDESDDFARPAPLSTPNVRFHGLVSGI
jgi:hypothetical protein